LAKGKAQGFCGVFLSAKSVLAMIFPAAVICLLSCIAASSYANPTGRLTLLSAGTTRTEAVIGTLNEPEIKAQPEQPDKWQTVRMRVTAYCPCEKCCGKYADGVTACGHRIRPGDAFVAADGEYPFGTEMVIAGYKNGQPVKVLDRGGVIKDNRLDVFFHSHDEALKWGVKRLDVKVRRNS